MIIIINILVNYIDERTLIYKQVEDGFSNPNGSVNKKSLEWLVSVMKIIQNGIN